MASRQYPGLGLTGGWSSGEDGWGTALNQNLFLLSATCQGIAVDVMDTLPLVAADGEIYLLSSLSPTNPGMIAVRDDGMWRYLAPKIGWEFYVGTTDAKYRYTGGDWVGIQTAATVPPFSAANQGYNLSVNPMGTGLIWTPAYSAPHEIPIFNAANLGNNLVVIPDPLEPANQRLGWAPPPLGLPAIPANSKGKVAVIAQDGASFAYEEDGKYKAIPPGYVVTDDDMTGRVILGATGNITLPAGLTRGSTLTIARMTTSEVEIEAGAGVTLNVADGRTSLRSRFSAVSIVRTGLNQYLMFGDTSV